MMLTINDLTADRSEAVAVEARDRASGLRTWVSLMPEGEYSALMLAREGGYVLTGQRRGEDGRMRLMSKLARVSRKFEVVR